MPVFEVDVIQVTRLSYPQRERTITLEIEAPSAASAKREIADNADWLKVRFGLRGFIVARPSSMRARRK